MRSSTRILAAGVALLLVAASCGGSGTGEAPGAPKAAATAAPATQAVTAPAPVAPAKATYLNLVVDTVRGQAGLTDAEKKLDTADGLHCVVMSKFPQGSRIVWRVRVTDPLTQKTLDDKALASVELTLPDGKTQALKYGPHGGTKENPADHFWATGWSVPNDYPTGVFNHKITAKTAEGVAGVYGFDFFKVPAAQLTIIPKDLGKRNY